MTDRKRGSALVMAIWTIAILSVMVINFAVEAKLQSAANVYVRERVRMDYLIDAGKVLAAMIIANYQNAPDYAEDEDIEQLLEDDRWLQEKRELKTSGSAVTIGPIAVDEQHPENGTITVQIESVGGGEGGSPKFNINTLFPQGDPHYAEIWENILCWAGVPHDPDGGDDDDVTYFINCWTDWRDEDDTKVGDYGDSKDGSESEYYEDFCEENGDEESEMYKPRNGQIKDLQELAKLAFLRKHPALLTGGWYYPLDEVKEENNIYITNTLDKVLTTFGGNKINVNLASKDVLMCIPGVRSTDDPTETEDAELISQAIIDFRETGVDIDGKELDEDDPNGTLIKDWNKIQEITDSQIGATAQEYLAFTGGEGDGALYLLTFTASSMGMKYVVKAKMTIKESKPIYLEWQENPSE